MAKSEKADNDLIACFDGFQSQMTREVRALLLHWIKLEIER